MKGFPGFGAPKQQHLSMQLGYDPRPSWWQRIKSNAHLVIAAVGTVALLGVAGVALWLAMPANERQAFAEPKHPVPQTEPTVQAAAPQAAGAAKRSDEVTPQTAAQEAELPALAANDPRWTAPKPGSAPDSAPAQQAQAKADAGPAESAFAESRSQAAVAAAAKAIVADDPKGTAAADDSADAAPTAAIPAGKVEQPDAPAENGKPGHILKPVTMRAGPKRGAAALVTLQAKTSVRVISCKKWCQIVYKGKTGWVYNTYLHRDG